MKRLYILILLGLFSYSLSSQNFVWAKREGLWAYDYGYGIVNDSIGNVYIAGKYELNSNFSNTILPYYGNHDIYVAKYSPDGALNWIRTAGGDLGDYAHALYSDGRYLYIAGEVEGYGNTIFFEGSPITLSCIGDNDVFIAKYNLDGDLIWAVNDGGKHDDKALGVTTDFLGNVYVCGYFTDTAIFGNSVVYGHGGNDIFIAKYNKNGLFQWVKSAGGPNRDEAKGIRCDRDDNVYITGLYSDSTVFGTSILTSPLGYFDIFLAKYDSDGNLIWLKTAGGDYDDVGWALTIDNQNKIYVTGEFNAYAHFDSVPLTTTGEANIFVACYNDSGTVEWAASAGGPAIDRARGIGCIGSSLYVTGQFGLSATFGQYSVTGVDSSEIFIAKLNNTGNFQWATTVGGPPDTADIFGYESGMAVCAQSNGNIYATGALLNGGTFGDFSFLPPYSRTDAFITKLSDLATSHTNERTVNGMFFYPNPTSGGFTIRFSKQINSKFKMSVTNCLGRTVYSRWNEPSSLLNIDLSEQPKGIYFIEIVDSEQTVFREKIVLQ